MLDDSYALTEDEKAAGVGSLLDGSYDRSYYRSHSSGRSYHRSNSRSAYDRSYYRSHSSGAAYPANHGKKWTAAELSEVARQFSAGKSIDYTANYMERTCYSIAWQLYEMDLITEKQREAIKSGLRKIELRKDDIEDICFVSDEKISLGPLTTKSTVFEQNKSHETSAFTYEEKNEQDSWYESDGFFGLLQFIGLMAFMFFLTWLVSLF